MRAICVFSGGLDSMLAAQLIKAQGIDVVGLFFETPFFTSGRAKESARSLSLPLRVVDITATHLEMLRKPIHGYGGNMNPCIDCHILMIRSAGEFLQEEKASFIITGEVLGQRPMSQNKKALSIVARGSGFDGLVLRPLSAKCLPITLPEEKGWVERERLTGFSGRSRKPQMELAKRFGITDYPAPAGGCLLTDPVFSRRLRDLFSHQPSFDVREVELLKVGRHFRVGPGTKLIVGRNVIENQRIRSLSIEEDLLIQTVSIPGPTVLVTGESRPEDMEIASRIAVSYSDAKDSEPIEVRVEGRGLNQVLRSRGVQKDMFKSLMI